MKKISHFSHLLPRVSLPGTLARASSLHAWWLDTRLKIPIINLHQDKLWKRCVSFSLSHPSPPPPLYPLLINMRYRKISPLLMRTGLQPQRHRRWPPLEFFKRPCLRFLQKLLYWRSSPTWMIPCRLLSLYRGSQYWASSLTCSWRQIPLKKRLTKPDV